jgi:hypothetical protein
MIEQIYNTYFVAGFERRECAGRLVRRWWPSLFCSAGLGFPRTYHGVWSVVDTLNTSRYRRGHCQLFAGSAVIRASRSTFRTSFTGVVVTPATLRRSDSVSSFFRHTRSNGFSDSLRTEGISSVGPSTLNFLIALAIPSLVASRLQ